MTSVLRYAAVGMSSAQHMSRCRQAGQGPAGRALRPALVLQRTEVEVAAVDGGQVALVPGDDVVLLLLGGGPHRGGRHKVAARAAQGAGARLQKQLLTSAT